MISPKLLSGLKAKSRQVAVVPRPLADVRATLIALIDDFWRYYCNPGDFSYIEKRIDPATGTLHELHVPGRWRADHHIVQHRDGHVVISLEWDGRLLPLTKRGDQEIVLGVATPDVVEQILAEIKHSIKTGRMDASLVRDLL